MKSNSHFRIDLHNLEEDSSEGRGIDTLGGNQVVEAANITKECLQVLGLWEIEA